MKKNILLPFAILLLGGASLNQSFKTNTVEITGTWIADFQEHKWNGVSESLWITMRANTKKDRHGFNFTLDIKDLDGLGISRGHNGKSAVVFSLTREAGSFNFEGQFVDDAGSGTFTFADNPEYITKMGRLGYRSLDDDQVMMLAIHDVTTTFVEELVELGFANLSYDDLLASVIHGLSPRYIRAIQAQGYKNLTHDQYIAMRIHGISVKFIQEMAGLGFNDIPYDDLVAVRIHGVSESYIVSLAELGYHQIPVSRLVEMRIHGVSAEFVREVKEAGHTPSVEKLIEMRIHGVDSRLLKAVKH